MPSAHHPVQSWLFRLIMIQTTILRRVGMSEYEWRDMTTDAYYVVCDGGEGWCLSCGRSPIGNAVSVPPMVQSAGGAAGTSMAYACSFCPPGLE